MNLVFASHSLPKSIFLAGPTPRSDKVQTWRKEAITILERLNFDGSVLIPEGEDWTYKNEYLDQVSWEWEALNMSTCVVFWVPREIQEMPGFTTNVEYGLMATSRKSLLSYPLDAPKVQYLETLAISYHIPVFNDLKSVLAEAVRRCDKPFGLAHLK